jgi:hypothetical protein
LSTNYDIIGDIINIIKLKFLTVVWTKVKGHSGIIENDIADEIATQAGINARSNPDLIIQDSNLINSTWNFSVHWNGTIWNGSLRKNFSYFSSLFYCFDWSNNGSISSLFGNGRVTASQGIFYVG